MRTYEFMRMMRKRPMRTYEFMPARQCHSSAGGRMPRKGTPLRSCYSYHSHTFAVWHRSQGFTLIELLVVVAIIGILSSIVLVNLNNTRQKARDVKRIADIKQLQLSLALYFDANGGKYPGTLTTGGQDELAPTFIPSIPTPPGGITGVNSYAYVPLNVANGSCNSYHLGASLEQMTNIELTTDADAVPGLAGTNCGGAQTSAQDFNGRNQTHCMSGTVGIPQPGGSEVCYDVTP